jgi:CDP-diacylglycerol--glycerol-3-phosphate 3-phosphatidyltransferase
MDPSARSSIRRDLWNLPNILTMGRILVIPLVCVLLYGGGKLECIFATSIFGAAAITDWLDGWLARRRNLVSLTGKFLDPLADKLLVMAVFCTLLPMGRIPLWFVVLSLAREFAVTGLRALAAGEGLIIAADWGGKWKTAFQLVGLVCLMIYHPYTVYYGLFSLDLRFSHVGFALLLISLGYSLTSGWAYFAGFLAAIGEREQAEGSASA